MKYLDKNKVEIKVGDTVKDTDMTPYETFKVKHITSVFVRVQNGNSLLTRYRKEECSEFLEVINP